MNERPEPDRPPSGLHSTDPPQSLGDRLMEEHGDQLREEHGDLTDRQMRDILLALYRIMETFVEMGFSIAPGTDFSGENKDKTGRAGMDDVLERVAPDKIQDSHAVRPVIPCL